MKRASYKDAIDWISQNESAADDGALNPATVAELASACLVADIFGVSREKVGNDIVARRNILAGIDPNYSLSVEWLRRVFSYDQETGIFTRLIATSSSVRVGDIAGSKHIAGYRTIRINGHSYLCHRLAWLYVYGRWPADQLDHINGDRSDDRIANLRECSNKENCQNVRSHKDGTSKHVGVSLIRSRKRSKPWMAQICVDGVQRKLGCFVTEEEALQARISAKKVLHQFEPNQ